VACRIFVSHVCVRSTNTIGPYQVLDRPSVQVYRSICPESFVLFDGDYAAVRDDILEVLRAADVVLTINMRAGHRQLAVQDDGRSGTIGIPIGPVGLPSNTRSALAIIHQSSVRILRAGRRRALRLQCDKHSQKARKVARQLD